MCVLIDTWQVLDGGLVSAGVPYSYGFSIILLTLLVKLATYPLSKKQVCYSAHSPPLHHPVPSPPACLFLYGLLVGPRTV